MNTFLPYADFDRSAHVLDNLRLNKQRVETFQILCAITQPTYGWQHHPAVNMWRVGRDPKSQPFIETLIAYGMAIHAECDRRGIADDKELGHRMNGFTGGSDEPPWLHDNRFHRAMRSNLCRKKPEHYNRWFRTRPDLEYLWPSKHPDYMEILSGN